MTKQQIADFFASPAQPLHRRFEAMRSFFLDHRPAREVAERFGYSRSAVYNMTRDFRQLDDPATFFFREPVPRGRPAVASPNTSANASSPCASATFPCPTSRPGSTPNSRAPPASA